MGAVDKLLNFMKLTEDEEYDEYDEYEEEEEEPDTERRSFFRKKDTVREESNVIEPITYTSRETKDPKPRRFGSGKVVSMNGHGVEVYVIKPQDFAEAQTAADLLKEGKTVVINLEGVELTVAQRSIDLWAERPMRLTAPFRLFPTIFLLRHRTASRSMEI